MQQTLFDVDDGLQAEQAEAAEDQDVRRLLPARDDLQPLYYHQPRFGRAALALDLMEPFRPLIADSAVLNAINTRMVTAHDFVQAGNSVSLTPSGRKAFFRAFEQRMDRWSRIRFSATVSTTVGYWKFRPGCWPEC